ncbi:hypothetical protein DNTS_032823 [Danionella cerebrum]|uniref:Rapunzel 4 n=1 Tax=Danionella cerebrum TaxID=2873325 RepID=A0A553QVL1_9TELE|nr:hypothetical protein DNTS_032823 [Danionella translucida]
MFIPFQQANLNLSDHLKATGKQGLTYTAMAAELQEFIAQKKGMVEDVMDVFEKGAEFVASIAGDLFPVFSIVGPIVKLALDNKESKETRYMTEQFQKVRDHLEVVSEQVQQINQEIKKSGMDADYFSVEENISNQFRKFMDVLNAKPQYREVRKKTFLEYFNKTGGNRNLHTLYDAVTGNNFAGESILEITLNYEQKSRRVVEEFCAMLKKLFCVGLITLLGQAALKGDDEEKLLQEWIEKIKVVQSKIDVVIEDCINSFPTQAEEEAKRIVRDQSDKTNQQLADVMLEHLKKKYDWVCWSVRVFNSPPQLFGKPKDFQGLTGRSRFTVEDSNEKLNVVVSYSTSPEPVDKPKIQSWLLEQKKLSVISVAERLFEAIPACVVHTIRSSCQRLAFSSSFSDELLFFEQNKKFHVFLHSA